jgi:hypothetical protein
MSSPSRDLYEDCVTQVGGENVTANQCITLKLNNDVGARELSQGVLLVYAAALVFFMQAGFAMVCAGAVRKKKVQNTMLKNLMDVWCGAVVAYFVVGFAFSFGGMDETSPKKTFVGTDNFFLVACMIWAFGSFSMPPYFSLCYYDSGDSAGALS